MAIIDFGQFAQKYGLNTVSRKPDVQEPVKVVEPVKQPTVTVTHDPVSSAANLQGGSLNLQGSSVQPQKTAPATTIQKTVSDKQLQPSSSPSIIPFGQFAQKYNLPVTGVDGTPAPVRVPTMGMENGKTVAGYEYTTDPNKIARRGILDMQPELTLAQQNAEYIKFISQSSTGDLLKRQYGDNWLTKSAAFLFTPLDPITWDISDIKVTNDIKEKVASGQIDQSVYDGIETLKKSGLQIGGDVGQAVLTAYTPNIGINLVKESVAQQVLKKSLLTLAKEGGQEGAYAGFQYGVTQALSSGSTDPDEITKIITLNTVGGAALGTTFKTALPALRELVISTNRIKQNLVEELVSKGYTPEQAKQMAIEGGYIGGLPEKPVVPKSEEPVVPKPKEEPVTILEKQAEKELPQTKEERGVFENIRKSTKTSEELRGELLTPEHADTRFYDVATDKVAIEAAQKRIAQSVDAAHAFAKSGLYNKDVVATGLELIKKYDAEGAAEYAYDIIDHLSKLATETGQANQAWSLYNRLSPEGMVKFAERTVEKMNTANPKRKPIVIDEAFKSDLRQQAKKVAKLPEGSFEKKLETAKMTKMVSDQIPSSFLRKVSTVQTMAQLLNPRTIIRNIAGNAAFAGMENVSQTVATGLDKLTSLFTGKRTQGLPSLMTQVKGFGKGWLEGFVEAKSGVHVDMAGEGKFGGNTAVFKGKVGKAFQTALDVSLRVPDKAFYQAAFEDSLRVQMKLKGVTTPTAEMVDQAVYDGLYRTFQDESTIAKGLMAVKKGLNMLTGSKDFGLGDLVLKYPKVPGNILSRGIAYTPAGFVRTVFELAKPLFGKEFNQRAFVDSTAKALTGSGLIGSGILLHRLGIITGQAEDNKNIQAMNNQVGVGQYRFNVSALRRYVTSGFNGNAAKMKQDDTLIGYDWLQPTAVSLAVGANIDQNLHNLSIKKSAGELTNTLVTSMAEGSNTLAEQPVLTGLTRSFKYADTPVDAVMYALQSVPSSFIPTLSSQIRQAVDPNMRDARGKTLWEGAINQAKNKIPGLDKSLPQSYDTLGRKQVYRTPLEAFFSPATLGKVQQNSVSKMVLDIYEKTGDASGAPRVVSLSQQISKFKGKDQNGKPVTESQRVKISAKEAQQMQKWIGQTTNKVFSTLSTNEQFRNAPVDEQAKYLSGLLSDINTAAKIKFIGHQPASVSKEAEAIYKMFP